MIDGQYFCTNCRFETCVVCKKNSRRYITKDRAFQSYTCPECFSSEGKCLNCGKKSSLCQIKSTVLRNAIGHLVLLKIAKPQDQIPVRILLTKCLYGFANNTDERLVIACMAESALCIIPELDLFF